MTGLGRDKCPLAAGIQLPIRDAAFGRWIIGRRDVPEEIVGRARICMEGGIWP